jgi:hypothetical protein
VDPLHPGGLASPGYGGPRNKPAGTRRRRAGAAPRPAGATEIDGAYRNAGKEGAPDIPTPTTRSDKQFGHGNRENDRVPIGRAVGRDIGSSRGFTRGG